MAAARLSMRTIREILRLRWAHHLSKKQIALYKELIKNIEDSLEDKEGIDRKGIVLSSIMKFKQICNHPDHYLGKEDYKIQDSGKFDKLREICESIYEKREKVIILFLTMSFCR